MNIRRIAFLGLAAAALAAFALPAQAAYLRVHAAPASMTALDSGKPDKNLSDDASSKILVNYEDGAISAKGVTAVLLRLPDALLAAQPADLARATLVFHVLKANNWQPTVFSPRLFPLAAPYTFSEATWNDSADKTPWATPGGDTLDAFGDGTYDARSQTLSFNLLPLLSDPDAAAALKANGALIRLAWDALPDSGFSMLNLHNTQAAAENLPDAYFVLQNAPSVDAPSPAVSDLPTLYYIDGSPEKADSNLFTDTVRFILNPDETRGDTRVLVALPDLDLPTVASLGALHFGAALKWNGNPEIPAFASVLTVPFGATEATAATWNRADHSNPDTAWNGGAFSDALSFPAVFGEASVDFDLSPLLASDLRDAAFANGLLLQWDVSARASVTNKHVMATLYRDNPAPTLSWSQRPVVHSYIDSGKPDGKFGWSGATNGKCIVLLNADGGEARTLVKFAPSFFNFDPAQNPALFLSFPYWKEWPGEDEPNQIALQPLASPFRMDQATWNKASDKTAWTTPGGDLDETISFVGTVDRAAQTITFDLTSLYFDPTVLAELIENGAALRILGGHPVETSSVGFNFWGTSGPVAIAIAADGVEFRGFSIDYPAAAEAEPAAKDASEGPTCSLDLTGLDPTVDYAVYACSDLAAGEWTWLCDVPDDGQVTFPATGSISFFRVQPRE